MCTNLRLCCFYCDLCIDPDSPNADESMRRHVDTHTNEMEIVEVFDWENSNLEWLNGRFT